MCLDGSIRDSSFEFAFDITKFSRWRNPKALGDGGPKPFGQRRHHSVLLAQIIDPPTKLGDLAEQGLSSTGSLGGDVGT